MADRAISALPTATTLTASDLFVLSQSNQAKNTTWQTIIGYLTTALDGHGGINSITYTPPVSPSLDGTLTITLADSTHYDVTITNGNGVTGVVQHWAVSSSNSTAPSTWYTTLQTMTPTNRYLWNYITVEMDDGNDINTTPCVAGVYGDTGQAWYVWVRYSGTQPTSDADMGTTPDDWIGLYSGTESDPSNLHYTDFNWFKYKGEKGDTGAAATVTNQSVTYQESSSGTVVPSGSWTTTIPTVTQGNYLWTRTVLTYNSGTTVTSYSVARFGVDGSGSVASVNNQSPDGNGNVSVDASDIPMSDNQSVEAHINTLHKYMTVVGEASFEEEAYDSQISQVVQWYGFTPESGDNTVDVKDGDFIIISFPQAHPWLSTNYSRVGIVTPSGYIYYLITGSEVTGTGEYNTHFAFRFNGTYLIPVDLNGMTEKLAELKTSLSDVKSDLGIVEDGDIATHAISAGQYVIWKGSLYTASSAISVGTTLSSSNLTAVSNGGFNDLLITYGSSTNGQYIKFANGVLIQWGAKTGANGMTVTLPTSFNNAGYEVSMNAHYNTNTSIVCIFSELDRTVSSFKINAWDASTRAASTATNISVMWIAIGTWK